MNPQQPDKVYVPKSSAKEITFQKSGKTILKLGFKSKELVEFIRTHTNPNGYINLGISRRREVSKYKDTHCIWLDTWQPEQSQKPQSEPQPPTDNAGDDVPF